MYASIIICSIPLYKVCERQKSTLKTMLSRIVAARAIPRLSPTICVASRNYSSQQVVQGPIFNIPGAIVDGVSIIVRGASSIVQDILSGLMNIKRTFQPSILKRKRTHGFLARVRSRTGRKILNARRAKGRKELCA